MHSDTLHPSGRAVTDPGPAHMAPVPGRRRPWLIATGVLLATLGALVVVWLVGAAGQRQEVLVVRQAVAYGERLEAEHLGLARVSLDPGVQALASADRDLVVGQVAVTSLVPGMLLTPGMVEPRGEPDAGRVLVPISLPTERMPAGGLRAGDRILAVDSGGPSAPASPAGAAGSWAGDGIPALPATVVRVGPTDVNGTTVVDVTTSAPDGPVLAAAAANGRVALVVQPVGD